jgi:hypothetical protein
MESAAMAPDIALAVNAQIKASRRFIVLLRPTCY